MIPGEDNLRTTGGQIDSIVLALIDATLDRDDGVTQAIQSSLFNIGKHQPNLVLSSCHSYLERHPKLALVHKIIILAVVEKICNERLSSIQKAVAGDVIKLAVDEMVNTKEIVPEWQNLASGILVSLGHDYVNEVMEQLLTKFQPGVLPHFFVVQTMANLVSANVFGMVPFLKSVIGTMLPLLGMVRSENMKWIFAYALSKFCEGILEYIANADKSPDSSVTKESFTSEITSAYDLLFNNWLPSREAKVRSEVVVAMGHMTHLLSLEKLEEHLPRIIPAILSIYKRHQEYQHTTQGLCMVLDAAISNNSLTLGSQLDAILSALFPQICSTPDYSQPAGVRNHNEVLRCFAVLAAVYSDRLIPFLLLRLENSNEPLRIGALTVLRHLVNTSGGHIGSKVPLVINGIKQILNSSNKVKKVIAQVVVTLAHHDHLRSDEGLELVKFIIQQCALPDEPSGRRPPDPGYVSNEALRGMCENVMHLLTTTVEKMEEILWPSIIDCLLDETLSSAVSSICKCLTILATKEREELGLDFSIDYAALSKVITPQCLLARLLVLIGRPLVDRERGIHALRFMRAVAPAIHKGPVSLWDHKIPALIQYIEATDPVEWDQKAWEEKAKEFSVETLSHIGQDDWVVTFGKNLLYQFPLYMDSPDDKYVLLTNLGLVLSKVANKSFLNEALDIIFQSVNHANPIERMGCAEAVGLCGSVYPDLVLVKLENVAKNDKKNAGLFGFIREFTGDSDHEKLKATIILCYGYVTVNTPISQISSRIETPILRCVANFYSSSKDPVVKQSMLESIRLIAEAVRLGQQQRLCLEELRSRGELLSLMKAILKAEAGLQLTSNVRALALRAAAGLVGLNPVLKEEEKRSLVVVAVGAVCSLPRDFLLERPDGLDLDFDQLLIQTVEALNFFLQQLLLKERTFVNLESILLMLHVWMVSKNAVERERCLHSTLHLLRAFAQATEGEAYAPFTTLGSILGLLVPRCTDPQITVRHLAFDSIDVAVAMAMKVQVSAVSFNEKPEFSLHYLKAQIISEDPNSLFTVTKNLGKVMCEKLPLEQLYPFVRGLVGGLCDPHPQSSSGASVVLNTVIKHRGRELRIEIPNIMDSIRNILGNIQCPHTRKGALRAFQSLANHHLSAVLVALLNTPVPLDVNTIDIWKTLCQDKAIANHIVENFLEIFSDNVISSPPDPHGRSVALVAAHKPLSAVCALREMFKVSEMEGCAREHFDQLLASLLLVTGAYVGAVFPLPKAKGPTPVRLSIETLKNLLLCVREDVMVASMTEGGYWAMMEEADKFPMATAALARAVCMSCPEQVAKLTSFVNPLLSSGVEVQRVVAVGLLVEFLTQCYEGRGRLTEPLVGSLLGRLADPSPVVRRLCIHGLGSVSALDKEQIERYSTTILSAMMSGMDDREDPDGSITLAAMGGLSQVLTQVAEAHVRPILINIALRIKPMFEKEKASVRAAAFTLFGDLCKFGEGPSKEQFVEQVHGNLVPLLLHLNDGDKHVVRACKYSLRLLAPFLNSKDMNEMFQKHLLDDAHLHYGDFVNDLTKTVITDFPDKLGFHATNCMAYLKSSFIIIQCNAAAFLGYLLGNLKVESQHLIPKERICSALLLLLKDPSPEVRIRASESLSLLYDF